MVSRRRLHNRVRVGSGSWEAAPTDGEQMSGPARGEMEMSKFDLLVVLPPTPPERYDAAIAEAMEPYSAQESTYERADPNGIAWVEELRAGGVLPQGVELTWPQVAEAYNSAHGYENSHSKALRVGWEGRGYWLREWNPNGRWDYYGAYRHEGPYFPYRPEAADDSRLWIAEYPEEFASRGPLAGLTARCDGGPLGLLDLETLRDTLGRLAAEDHDAWRAGNGDAPRWDWFRFTEDREENIAKARASAVPASALLRLDGTWADADDWRDDHASYWQYVNAYLDALSDDTVVLAVTCHC
ncbi:hypothetical protein Kpho02_38520 [Kitasatospora phosalacinea]|uniref:Uncharacterized protein n=2 Tax=Kitasatospora phosalacinea TaxID=2065 RepID=A0A9W6V2S9_9ACTN|nr:hypothetical protein Kpho02_38520 [Kitasatospora phosalacinea]